MAGSDDWKVSVPGFFDFIQSTSYEIKKFSGVALRRLDAMSLRRLDATSLRRLTQAENPPEGVVCHKKQEEKWIFIKGYH